MSIKMKSLLCLMVCTVSFPVFSTTLSEAYNLAKTYDPLYLSAIAQNKVTQAAVQQATSAYLPHLVISGGPMYSKTKLINQKSPLQSLTPTSQPQPNHKWLLNETWNVTAEQTIFDLSALNMRKSAVLHQKSAEYGVTVARYQLVQRLTDAYLAVIAIREKLETLYLRKKFIVEQFHQAQRKFEAGSATIADVQEAKAAYLMASSDIVQNLADERAAEASLQNIVGHSLGVIDYLPFDKLSELKITPINTSVSYWVSMARQKSPTILASSMMAKAALNDIQTERAKHLPVIKLQGISAYSNQLPNSINTASTPTVTPIMADGSMTNSVGLQVTMPVFLGGGISSAVHKSIYNSVISQQQYRNQYNQISLQAEQGYLNFSNGLHQMKALKAALESAKIALIANQTAYQVGRIILIDVLNAQTQVYSVSLRFVDSVMATLKAYISLKIASGTFSDSDLKFIDDCLLRR